MLINKYTNNIQISCIWRETYVEQFVDSPVFVAKENLKMYLYLQYIIKIIMVYNEF